MSEKSDMVKIHEALVEVREAGYSVLKLGELTVELSLRKDDERGFEADTGRRL